MLPGIPSTCSCFSKAAERVPLRTSAAVWAHRSGGGWVLPGEVGSRSTQPYTAVLLGHSTSAWPHQESAALSAIPEGTLKHQEAKRQGQGRGCALSSFISGDWRNSLEGACILAFQHTMLSSNWRWLGGLSGGRDLRQSLRGGTRPHMALRAPQSSPSILPGASQVWPVLRTTTLVFPVP